jgi:hypothetical protein
MTGKTQEELPPVAIKLITQLFNAFPILGYFPDQWKVAQIILILKPDKPPHVPTSYRPISHLSIPSKVYQVLLFHTLTHIAGNDQMLPDQQFYFRHRHPTIQQTSRIAKKINEAIERKEICSAAFLDISRSFDKVWHTGLLFKLRLSFPLN